LLKPEVFFYSILFLHPLFLSCMIQRSDYRYSVWGSVFFCKFLNFFFCLFSHGFFGLVFFVFVFLSFFLFLVAVLQWVRRYSLGSVVISPTTHARDYERNAGNARYLWRPVHRTTIGFGALGVVGIEIRMVMQWVAVSVLLSRNTIIGLTGGRGGGRGGGSWIGLVSYVLLLHYYYCKLMDAFCSYGNDEAVVG